MVNAGLQFLLYHWSISCKKCPTLLQDVRTGEAGEGGEVRENAALCIQFLCTPDNYSILIC